jgi:hypothetical protein
MRVLGLGLFVFAAVVDTRRLSFATAEAAFTVVGWFVQLLFLTC